MENNTFNWAGYEWQSGHRWGNIHPEEPHQYYTEEGIEINDEGHLIFNLINKPKEFNIDGEKIISPLGIGMASCKEYFEYGIFEIDAKWPSGTELWPAFWLWSFENDHDPHYRYAEIDGIEAYTKKKGNYLQWNGKRPWGWWRMETNFHYMTEPGAGWDTRTSIGARTGFMGFKNPSKHFMKYRIEWKEDSIKVYYNGYRVRYIKDKKVLSHFTNMGMNLILGTGATRDKNQHSIGSTKDKPFIIKSFKYTPYSK